MDPLGFALEHFDAVGRFRATDEAHTAVDASATLPGGETFAGLAGLRDVLADRSDQFIGTVAARLFGFALGRDVEHFDRPTLRRIVRETAPQHRWSSLIRAIVRSPAFQMRRAES
jgi:hypothetical protein